MNKIIDEIEREGYMKLKILFSIAVCLLLFAKGTVQFSSAKSAPLLQEDPEIAELKEKQMNTMKDISTISTALADYVTDNGVTPEQDGTFEENEEFINALSPFYVKRLPILDAWGNPFRVYCGEACNGKYGITGCEADDFVVVSYGRDGKKEDFEFDRTNPEAGLFEIESADDFDKDIIMWNGSWVRAPRPRRR